MNVCRVGEGVDWPVKTSGEGKIIVDGLSSPLEGESMLNATPSLFLLLPPQLRRML